VVAAEQVKVLLGRSPPEEVTAAVPLFVFDAGYDPVRLQQGLEDRRCQRFSSVCERVAASRPIRVGRLPQPADHVAMGTSSSARTPRAGRSPRPSTHLRGRRLRDGARARLTQLRLARSCVADRRLPWERRYAPGQLTPLRVRRGVLALLLMLGTPAKPPKPCGRSPGWPKGRCGQGPHHPGPRTRG
jgi:hypothetical protein